jgi:hypothetical protein
LEICLLHISKLQREKKQKNKQTKTKKKKKTINLRKNSAHKQDGKTKFQMNLATNRQLSYNGLFETFLAIRAGDLFVPPVKLT